MRQDTQQELECELREQANSLFREEQRKRHGWRVRAGLITAERLEQQIDEELSIVNRLTEEHAVRREGYFGEKKHRRQSHWE